MWSSDGLSTQFGHHILNQVSDNFPKAALCPTHFFFGPQCTVFENLCKAAIEQTRPKIGLDYLIQSDCGSLQGLRKAPIQANSTDDSQDLFLTSESLG